MFRKTEVDGSAGWNANEAARIACSNLEAWANSSLAAFAGSSRLPATMPCRHLIRGWDTKFELSGLSQVQAEARFAFFEDLQKCVHEREHRLLERRLNRASLGRTAAFVSGVAFLAMTLFVSVYLSEAIAVMGVLVGTAAFLAGYVSSVSNDRRLSSIAETEVDPALYLPWLE